MWMHVLSIRTSNELVHQIWAKSNKKFVCKYAVHGNCLTNQGPWNGSNSAKHEQKLIRPGESYNEFGHQIWAKFDEQFVNTQNLLFQLAVWYKTKFGSQNLATKFGNHLCMATKIGRQY